MFPKIIRTEAGYEAALAHAETLMDAAPGSAAEAELEVWRLVIEKYEDEHFPIARPDPVTAIEFRMEQKGLTRRDLLRCIPNKSKVSEVLGRRRPTLTGLCQPGELCDAQASHDSGGTSPAFAPGLRPARPGKTRGSVRAGMRFGFGAGGRGMGPRDDAGRAAGGARA